MQEDKDLRTCVLFDPMSYVQPYQADSARLDIFCHKMITTIKKIVGDMNVGRVTVSPDLFIDDIFKSIKSCEYFNIDGITLYYFDPKDEELYKPLKTELCSNILDFITENVISIKAEYPTGDQELDNQIMENTVRELEYGGYGTNYGFNNTTLVLRTPNKHSVVSIIVDLEKLVSLGIIKITNWKFDFVDTEEDLKNYLLKTNLWFELVYTNSPVLSNLKEMIQFIKSGDNKNAKESFKKLNESILEYYDSHNIVITPGSPFGKIYALPQHEEMYKTLVGMIKSMYPQLTFTSYLNIKTGEFMFVPYTQLCWW